MPRVSSLCSTTRPGSTGRVKLGHPVPDSNLSCEENSGSPVATSTYRPAAWLFQKSLWNGGSVAPSCVTSYCNGVRRAFRSASDGLTYVRVPAAAGGTGSETADDGGGAASRERDGVQAASSRRRTARWVRAMPELRASRASVTLPPQPAPPARPPRGGFGVDLRGPFGLSVSSMAHTLRSPTSSLVLLAALAALPVFVSIAACGGGDQQPPITPPPPPASTPEPVASTAPTDAASAAPP